MMDELLEHLEYLEKQLEEEKEICRSCGHMAAAPKGKNEEDICINCGTDKNIKNMETCIREIKEGLEEV